jgi:hypothetical protein
MAMIPIGYNSTFHGILTFYEGINIDALAESHDAVCIINPELLIFPLNSLEIRNLV